MITKYKYPRTYHLPYSPGASSDDKILANDDAFKGKMIVITEKMDGENTTIYEDGTSHARSLDSRHKSYHSWLAGYVAEKAYLLKELNILKSSSYRICGEYLYAKHSIGYDNLKSYFYGFSIWIENRCLNYNKTEEVFEQLGITPVPKLYVGLYDAEKVKTIAEKVVARGGEGIVVRTIECFNVADFPDHIAKYVRKDHVQTDKHWSFGPIEANKLAKD